MMAEISQRDKVLLGYSPSHLSNSQSRNSDVDFSDVFGGPPRRSSAQDSGYSVRNSHSFDDNEDVEDGGTSWLTLREKPVFGEASAGVRRRYASDDFFDDIFRGDQPSSSSQSPRVVPRRSPFSSAPGSRVMSPSRSLPLPETSASPAKFSLPGRLSNTDFIASTSMNQSSFSPSLSRFNQTMKNHDAGNRSSPRSSALPRQDTADVKESTSDSHLYGITDQSDNHRNAKGSEFPIYATNFHFSIYKWASKSVPLVISLRKKSPRSKETTKLDTLSSNKSVRPSSPAREREHCNDSFMLSMISDAKTKGYDASPVESNSTSVISPSNKVEKAREDVSSYGLEDAIVEHNLSSKSSGSVVHKRNDPPKLLPKTKSNMRPLRSFLNNHNEGNEKGSTEKTGDKMSRVKEKQKSSSPTKNDARTSEATSKVKDFVKIFNQESPSKASGGAGLCQSHSRRWKETKTVEVDYEIRFSSARMDDEMEASFVNWGEAWPDTSEMEDGNSSGSQQFNINDMGCVPDTARQTSPNAPSVDNLRDSATYIDVAFLHDDALDKEVTKGYETKVSQWSKGKEGNIRALLSTLQYVLWLDSGWKPIPLVDIIEENAVKKAYQKALLRLHPDKLQQKGAASHHKLIAEKVFDILQEAWEQFNSLDSL